MFRLKIGAEELQPCDEDGLYRYAKQRYFDDGDAFYWSEANKEWRPISGIMFDGEVWSKRVEYFKAAGFPLVEILGAGDDCRRCKRYAGKRYSVDAVPVMPAEGCKCIPWCRCMLIAVD